jgi:hypothetical protein
VNPSREWLCEYERYDGGDIFLGDDLTKKIVGRGKVKLNFMDGRCYQIIFSCENISTRSQSCVTIGGIYHCHLSIHFPPFIEGKKSKKKEASLVTLRDQIEILSKPTNPYIGHLEVQSRSRKGEGTNWCPFFKN